MADNHLGLHNPAEPGSDFSREVLREQRLSGSESDAPELLCTQALDISIDSCPPLPSSITNVTNSSASPSTFVPATSTTVFVNSVTVSLSSGSQLGAKPLDHAVGGHHVMLSQAGLVWKATRSAREKRFYELVLTHIRSPSWSPGLSPGADGDREGRRASSPARTACDCQLGEQLTAEETRQYWRAAAALVPFLPRYFGTRRVAGLKVSSVGLKTSGIPDSRTTSLESSVRVLSVHVAGTLPRSDSQGSSGMTKLLTSGHCTTDLNCSQVTTTTSVCKNRGSFAVDPGSPAAVTALLSKFADDQKKSRQQQRVGPEAEDSPVSVPATAPLRGSCPSCISLTANVTLATSEEENDLLTAASAQLEDTLSKQLPVDHPGTVEMIVLEDVCFGFAKPCVLDVKMGSRQYGLHATAEKRRSKELKSHLSTSGRYGIRLAGYRRWCDATQQFVSRSKLHCRGLSLEEVREELLAFLSSCTCNSAAHHSSSASSDTVSRGEVEDMPTFTPIEGIGSNAQQTPAECEEAARRVGAIKARLVKLLQRLLVAFETQTVFRFFTSSLLIVYDAARPLETIRVVMVDFAYTYEWRELVQSGDPDAECEFDVRFIKALETVLSLLA